MNEEVIAHMRGRIARVRKVLELAHDPQMIAMLSEMIVEVEADIKRLEAGPGRGSQPNPMPSPNC